MPRPFKLLLPALVLACACSAPPSTRDAAVLADSGGPIERALVVVTSPRRSALRNQALIESLTRRLGPRVHMLILADPEMIVEPNPWPERMSFLRIPDGLRFSIWPQDPFVVIEGASGSRLLAARDYGRAMDSRMAALAAEQLGWPVEQSALFFAGGNLVADQEQLFVGRSLIDENAEELGESPEQIVRRFEREMGRPVIPVAQVVPHIDMIVTALGGGRAAVADARAGAELASWLLAHAPDTVQRFEQAAEANFFGDPAVRSVTDTEGRPVGAPPLAGETRRAIADSLEAAAALDGIAEDLAARGYQVVRIPYLATRQATRGAAAYPMLSYNNVLLERIDGSERVYVAQYGLAPLDQAAHRAWQEAGFEVHPIPGVTTSAMYSGSVRCTVKVLERAAEVP